MAYLRCVRQSRGQALVEAVLVAPLVAIFVFMIAWCGRVLLTWQQISTAAQYGANLITYTPFSLKYIKKDIEDYLCNPGTIGRILDSKRLNIKIEINDYEPINYDFLNIKELPNMSRYDLENFLNTLKKLNPSAGKKSFVEIKYSYLVPKILRMAIKKNITIKSRSEVLSGTGSQSALKRQK
ncbi:MAG: pilus assembly protein [Endomicrobium sp.]|jgi:hypothetical protein|nr:pilus assembly protein [Endomicrobium sp.]